jgi:hypothetical protein
VLTAKSRITVRSIGSGTAKNADLTPRFAILLGLTRNRVPNLLVGAQTGNLLARADGEYQVSVIRQQFAGRVDHKGKYGR